MRVTEPEKVVTSSAYVLYYVDEAALDVDLPPPLQPLENDAIAAVAAAAAEGTGGSTPKKFKSSEGSCDTEEGKSGGGGGGAAESSSSSKGAALAELVAAATVATSAKSDEIDLSESQYICDICGHGVRGGWSGLMRHCKDVHDMND